VNRAQGNGRLIGVGVGPGDPELLTVKGIRALREADVVFVPVGDSGETGRAEAVVLAYIEPARVRRLCFALAADATTREASWDRAGAAVSEVIAAGRVAAFATLGDPGVYSTFAYLAATVRELAGEVPVEVVPGVTAMQDLAARTGTVLVEGAERLALLPLVTGPAHLGEALAGFDTVVCYKGGRHLPEIVAALRDAGRLDRALYGARLGLAGESIRPAAELGGRAEPGPYLSTVIALPERPARGSKL
jgi:precorrin-2/cobalt-factor-2 C20-methyltransferase